MYEYISFINKNLNYRTVKNVNFIMNDDLYLNIQKKIISLKNDIGLNGVELTKYIFNCDKIECSETDIQPTTINYSNNELNTSMFTYITFIKNEFSLDLYASIYIHLFKLMTKLEDIDNKYIKNGNPNDRLTYLNTKNEISDQLINMNKGFFLRDVYNNLILVNKTYPIYILTYDNYRKIYRLICETDNLLQDKIIYLDGEKDECGNGKIISTEIFILLHIFGCLCLYNNPNNKQYLFTLKNLDDCKFIISPRIINNNIPTWIAPKSNTRFAGNPLDLKRMQNKFDKMNNTLNSNLKPRNPNNPNQNSDKNNSNPNNNNSYQNSDYNKTSPNDDNSNNNNSYPNSDDEYQTLNPDTNYNNNSIPRTNDSFDNSGKSFRNNPNDYRDRSSVAYFIPNKPNNLSNSETSRKPLQQFLKSKNNQDPNNKVVLYDFEGKQLEPTTQQYTTQQYPNRPKYQTQNSNDSGYESNDGNNSNQINNNKNKPNSNNSNQDNNNKNNSKQDNSNQNNNNQTNNNQKKFDKEPRIFYTIDTNAMIRKAVEPIELYLSTNPNFNDQKLHGELVKIISSIESKQFQSCFYNNILTENNDNAKDISEFRNKLISTVHQNNSNKSIPSKDFIPITQQDISGAYYIIYKLSNNINKFCNQNGCQSNECSNSKEHMNDKLKEFIKQVGTSSNPYQTLLEKTPTDIIDLLKDENFKANIYIYNHFN